jgi:hypothetical protein
MINNKLEEQEKEEFKQYNKNYEISTHGNCRRILDNGTYRIINGSINNHGYKYLQISNKGKRTNILFHHMVAKCFLNKLNNDKNLIDHIDRNKLNNNINNLRYVNHKENIQNSCIYRNDIKETDKILRRTILNKELYYKKNGGSKTRKKGTGQLYQRENGNWRACIQKNNIRYGKTFKSKEEAENFLNELSYDYHRSEYLINKSAMTYQ